MGAGVGVCVSVEVSPRTACICRKQILIFKPSIKYVCFFFILRLPLPRWIPTFQCGQTPQRKPASGETSLIFQFRLSAQAAAAGKSSRLPPLLQQQRWTYHLPPLLPAAVGKCWMEPALCHTDWTLCSMRLTELGFKPQRYMQRGQKLKHPVFSSLCTLEWWHGKHTTSSVARGVQWGICTPKPKLLSTRYNEVKSFIFKMSNINMTF